MTTKNTYNGYTNYETWNCALWLDNDQGTQELMQAKAEELVEEAREESAEDGTLGVTPLNADRYAKLVDDMAAFIESMVDDMAAFIESMVDEMRDGIDLGASMFSDMLNASLREIDYRDIAESQLADAISELDNGKAA